MRDDIIRVENEIGILIAYVYTDDPDKVGTEGWHGPNKTWVEYIARPALMRQRVVSDGRPTNH